MSALQIKNRPSDAATDENGYDFADLRAAVLSDRDTALATRVAVGILIAVAAVIVIAGVATQSVVAIVGGAFAVAVLGVMLLGLVLAFAEPTRR